MASRNSIPDSKEYARADLHDACGVAHGDAVEKVSRLADASAIGSISQLFLSNGVLALCDQGVVSLGNFLTGLLIGRLVGKVELGLYALCWTIVSLTVDLSGAVTTTPYTVFGPHLRSRDKGRYVGNLFLSHFAISICVAGVIAIGACTFSRGQLPAGMLRTLLTCSAVLALLNAREFVRRICFADMAIRLTLVLDASFTLIYFAGLTLLWRTGSFSASSVYSLLGAVALAYTSLWLFLYRTKIRISRDWFSSGLQNWNFAKWVLASGVLWAAASYLYPWLLAAYHGTASAGLWASCSAVVAVGNPVLGGLVNYLAPKLSTLYARFGLDAMRRYVYKSSALLVLLLCPFALVIGLWGEQIIISLYGPAYSGTHIILVLLALNLLALSFSYPYSRGLFTLKAAKTDMLVNVAALGLLFLVGVVAVQQFSVTGGAAALLLTTLTTAAMRVIAFARTARQTEARLANLGLSPSEGMSLPDLG